MNLEKPLQNAIEAALAAGLHIMKNLDGNLTIDHKASNNFVTQVDRECEALIVQHLQKLGTDFDFMGEENQYKHSGARWLWVIDPLDGTSNFVRGIRWFSVSIGLWDRVQNKAILGVVHNPISGEVFYASEASGAWLWETTKGPKFLAQQIYVRQARSWPECLLATGFYYDRGKAMRATLEQAGQLMEAGVMDIRRCGSAALDLAMVASGRIDGFWEHILSPWDYIAGLCLVSEAGGVCISYDKQALALESSSIIAGNTYITNLLQDFISN